MNEEAGAVETAQGVQQALALNWSRHISHVENLSPAVGAILSYEPFARILWVVVGAILDGRVSGTCKYVTSCKVVHEGVFLDQCAHLIGDAVAEDVALVVDLAQHLASPDAVVNVSSTFARHRLLVHPDLVAWSAFSHREETTVAGRCETGEKESESGRQHLYQRHSSHCLAEFYLPWLILFLICGRSKCCSHELNYENNMLAFNPHSLTYLQCPMSNVNLPVLKFITSWILNLVKLKF